MRLSFRHLKLLLIFGIIASGIYIIIFNARSGEAFIQEFEKDLVGNGEFIKNLPKELTSRKHTNELPLQTLVEVKNPRHVVDSHKELPLPTHEDKSYSSQRDDLTEGTTVWAVLTGGSPWQLDLLLESLQNNDVVLVAKGRRSSDIDTVLRKYHTNALSTPNDCYAASKLRESCIKNNWLWLMKQAWSLKPEIVCFITDDYVLHRKAKAVLLQSTLFSGENYVTLSNDDTLTPWCTRENVWSEIRHHFDEFCSLEGYGWERSVQDILKKAKHPHKLLVPSRNLVFNLRNCDTGTGTGCSERVASFKKEDLDGTQLRIHYSEIHVSEHHEQSNLKDQAQCRGKVCEGFQYHETSDDRVYINHPMDGKGENSYIIDLGPTCIDMSKVHVCRGGEKVSDVLGRGEEEEFPRYDKGAFQIYERIPSVNVKFYQKDLLRSATVMNNMPTHFDFPGTTIAYTRYDYANVCFAVNDLFNLYLTVEHVTSNRMLWLDGHALGNLDNATSDLFDMKVMRLGHMTGTKCFERLVLQPKKYALYYSKKFGTCDVDDFVSKMWKKFNITPSEKKHDTVVIRDYYLAHPRVGKEVTRKFSEADLKNIREKLPNAKFIRFQEFSWKDQLQIIANTKTLYGMHGAGLQLGLFLGKGSGLVEWMHPSRVTTLTFPNLMTWRPDVECRRLYLKQWLTET